MRLLSTPLGLAVAAVMVAGCGGGSTGPSASSYLGSYGLVTIDGASLPLTILDTPTLKLAVSSGSWTLSSNGTFTEVIQTDVVANGFPAAPQLGSCTGSYERSGNTFTMTATKSSTCNGGTSTGTLDGRTLSVSADGSTLVFRR